MPYSGPGRGIDTAAILLPYNLRRQEEETAFDRSMRQAEQANRASSIMGESIARNQAQQERTEAGRAELAMTPGVSQGGVSSWNRPSVADSPALQPRSFQRYGQSYTYDPTGAATVQGAAEATRQTTAESQRLENLKKVPGITPTMAARIVYGRTGMEDPEGEKTALRTALGAYLANPSREAAVAAVQAGADLNPFMDKFLRDEPRVPVRGTPEYMAMRQQELEQEDAISERARAASDERSLRAQRATEMRSARTGLRVAEGAVRSVSNQRPSINESRYRNPDFTPDSATFNIDLNRWRADSTLAADNVTEAQDYLQQLIQPQEGAGTAARSSGVSWPPGGRSSPGAAPAPQGAAPAGRPDEAMMAQDAQNAIRKIMQSSLPQAEKLRRVQMVNARFKEWLTGGGR